MKGLPKYKKIKNLGEGAQGTVILALDTEIERKVAIKSLHESLMSDTLHVKRFKEEARTLASLGHSSIVKVYDYVANSSACHLIMEYFEGHPLDLYIRNVTGPIPEDAAIDIYIKVLDAMNHIHNKKIIHRDIKPSNIMINDKSEIRLLDFGIAKNTENDPTLTKIGASAGYTPMYMSPEHCNGSPITKYSDIYSLGVTLWQMLTGKAPYEEFTQGQIYLKVANEPLPSIQSVYQNVSQKMNTIVQKATHKNPKERYSSCDAFKKALEQLKNHIKEPATTFVFNLNVKIENELDATIFINEDQHYGTEFSKSFDVSNNSPIEIKIEKPGYKKFKKQLFLKRDEEIKINLEKQAFSIALVLQKLKSDAIGYLKNIPPNLNKLLSFLKLSSVWAFESIQLKVKKNNPEAVELFEKNIVETKKSIFKTTETIKPFKKEYASYLVLFSIFIISVFGLFSGGEIPPRVGGGGGTNSSDFPTVTFETLKTEIPESTNFAKIPVELSNASNSIVKIPLKFSGTASNGTDYNIITDTIIIQPNNTRGYVELSIIDDTVVENDKIINIELEKPLNATLGDNYNYSYTILNDDDNIIIKPKPRKPKKPKYPAYGRKHESTCDGYDLYQIYHDGKGGYYKGKLLERNAKYCGYTKPKTKSNYKENIIKTQTPNYYSDNFDDYFITYNVVKNKINFKVFSISKKRLISEYDFKGSIKNLYYYNKRLFTNKEFGIDVKHHLIDINNSSNNILSGNLIKQRTYLGKGNERKIKINNNLTWDNL